MIAIQNDEIRIPVGTQNLASTLVIPDNPKVLVLIAHGRGSSRHSSRNLAIAQSPEQAGFATLLINLLSYRVERLDAITGPLRFDISFLGDRPVAVARYKRQGKDTQMLHLGYFGASTGAAGTLVAAAGIPCVVQAIVARGGRPILAGYTLGSVEAPTLLIVGGDDVLVIQLTRKALERLTVSEKRMGIFPGAGHMFEEPGALEKVAELASMWFDCYLNYSIMRKSWNGPSRTISNR